MLRVSFVSWIGLSLGIFLSFVSAAFYDSDTDEKKFFFASDFNSRTLEGTPSLVLYDNFKHNPGRYHQKPILFPPIQSVCFNGPDRLQHSTL